jgi:hypothetical protein
MLDKGEHVMMELEVAKVALIGGVHKYSLKVPNIEDYLDKEYTIEQLITMDEVEENDTED